MGDDSDYDEDDATCVETHSTLRIFSDHLTPEEITAAVGIEPSETFRKGDLHSRGRLRREAHGWFFSTEGRCDSKDGRRHINLILEACAGKDEAFARIRPDCAPIDIVSYYLSAGQGGPCLTPRQMLRLGALGFEVWWDVYFLDDD